MLQHVQIKDFRCLQEVDVPLKPLTVLIGPNNTGKSAFLAALKMLATSPSPTAHVLRTDCWRRDINNSPTINGTFSPGGTVRVTKTPGTEGRWVWKGDQSRLGPASLFALLSINIAMESSGSNTQAGIPPINDQADNLPAYLDALLRKDRKRFFQIIESLRELVPGFTDLHIETPAADKRRIDLEFEDGLVLPGDCASDGVRLLLFFVALMHHPQPPAMILLEEPETGVHPKRLKDIVGILRNLVEGKIAGRPTQVILTTHSPDLLDCMDPRQDQVLVFSREASGACKAEPVNTDGLKLFLDEFMLGEVWLNEEEQGLVGKAP